MVSHDIPFRDGEVPVEDVKELPFHPANVLFRESTRPSGPSSVLDCVVRHVLSGGGARQGNEFVWVEFRMAVTFAERTRAPISILSHAQRSSDIWNCDLARSKYTRATSMTGVSMRDLRITSRASWRKGRGMVDGVGKRGEVGRPKAKSTVSIVVRTRYSEDLRVRSGTPQVCGDD